MTTFRRCVLCCLIFYFLTLPVSASAPLIMSFQGTFSNTESGLIEGRRNIIIGLYPGSSNTPVWEESHADILLIQGSFNMDLGNITALRPEFFDIANARFRIEIVGEGSPIYIPIRSVPYAIQAGVASVADQVSADNVVGPFDEIEFSDGTTLASAGGGSTSDISVGTPAGGDLGGTYPSPDVVRIQGTSVSATAPSVGQVLKYNSTTSVWEPSSDSTIV
ncbi:MAG: hypothetical protein HRT90_01125, partial [Candidatus Margulisbacteria bacterium]|nr:hypothetical protein [Candidatus Margulisiibacteriota bacterium]